jgi:hypothetical protein
MNGSIQLAVIFLGLYKCTQFLQNPDEGIEKLKDSVDIIKTALIPSKQKAITQEERLKNHGKLLDKQRLLLDKEYKDPKKMRKEEEKQERLEKSLNLPEAIQTYDGITPYITPNSIVRYSSERISDPWFKQTPKKFDPIKLKTGLIKASLEHNELVHPDDLLLMKAIIPAAIITGVALLVKFWPTPSNIPFKSAPHSQEDNNVVNFLLGDDPQPIEKIALF